VTPGSTPPPVSVTVPCNVALLVCAGSGGAASNNDVAAIPSARMMELDLMMPSSVDGVRSV
jgi:hypothetical protein